MDVHPALTQFLTEFKRVANAIVDSYFIVDTERRIVDFNRAFFAMLPRQVARGLKGKRCYEVLELNICANEISGGCGLRRHGPLAMLTA